MALWVVPRCHFPIQGELLELLGGVSPRLAQLGEMLVALDPPGELLEPPMCGPMVPLPRPGGALRAPYTGVCLWRVSLEAMPPLLVSYLREEFLRAEYTTINFKS